MGGRFNKKQKIFIGLRKVVNPSGGQVRHAIFA